MTVFLLPEKQEKAPAVKAPAEVKITFGLKLDRDLEAFAARLHEKEKP